MVAAACRCHGRPRDVRGGVRTTLVIDDYGGGHRRIHGTNDSFATFPIDIDVSPERLVAQIGTRKVELHAAGHYLVGRVTQHDNHYVEAPFVIYGREMLRTMVPADEALVLLLMITCNTTLEYNGRDSSAASRSSRASLRSGPSIPSPKRSFTTSQTTVLRRPSQRLARSVR